MTNLDSMYAKIEPCPFCGGTNLASPPGMAVICCGDCEASGPIGPPHPTNDRLTHLAGISKWNERAMIKGLRKELAQAKAKASGFAIDSVKRGERIKALKAENKRLRAAIHKVLLCFPAEIPEGAERQVFSIPAYIIEELREDLGKENSDDQKRPSDTV